MTRIADAPSGPPGPPLIAPGVAEWRAMSSVERERLLEEIIIRLTAETELMPEGRPHGRARNRVIDQLGQHFARIGRRIYLASDLAVLYPGERPFAPDVMAVLDVDDPGDDDERMAWVVAEEGKGLDLALEIVYSGDRKKDFVDNVELYARIGIPEYFVYDRRQQTLKGYRLPAPAARKYQEIRPRFGHFPSQVLGLDLVVREGRLRFLFGEAEVVDSQGLIERLERLVDDLDRRRQAEQARAEAEQARAEAEQARAEAALEQLRQAVLSVLEARGLPVPDALRARIGACRDGETLRRWTVRAATAQTIDAVTD